MLSALVFSTVVGICQFADARICAFDHYIRTTIGHEVTFRQDLSTLQVRAEYEWVIGAPDIIHLAATSDLTDEELVFILAHEVGHSVLKHGKGSLKKFASEEEWTTMSDLALFKKFGQSAMKEEDTELNHGQEFEADAFAFRLLRDLKVDVVKSVASSLKSKSSDERYPSRRARIEKAKQWLTANL